MLFNGLVTAADRYLADHHDELKERFEAEAPRWLPDAVYGRAFDRLHARLRERLAAMAGDPEDEARQQFSEWLAGLPERLQTSPELRERGEKHQARAARQRGLRDWTSLLWKNTKETLRDAGGRPRLRAPPPDGRPRWPRRAAGSAPTPRCRRAWSG